MKACIVQYPSVRLASALSRIQGALLAEELNLCKANDAAHGVDKSITKSRHQAMGRELQRPSRAESIVKAGQRWPSPDCKPLYSAPNIVEDVLGVRLLKVCLNVLTPLPYKNTLMKLIFRWPLHSG